MKVTQANVVIRHLRELANAGRHDSPSDRELLARFAAARDGEAFCALVERHGRLVLGVCRRVLGNWHDAEDAFQAAFLVLARNPAAVRKPESLGSWLHGVACRVSLRLREQRDARERRRARPARPSADPLQELSARELMAILDEEIGQLPEKYRAAVVLCHLEGRTRDEAARRLGLPLRTLQRRLERGRALLARRLERRGVVLSAALLTSALGGAAVGAVPPALVASAVRTALRASTTAVRSLWPMAAALALGAAGLWAALVAGAPAELPQTDAPQAMRAKDPAARQAPALPEKQGDLVATCIVRGADGKPVAGAEVMLLGLRQPARRTESPRGALLARGKTDAEGKCRLAPAGAAPAQFLRLHIVAAAPGAALAWEELKVAERPHAELTARQTREVSGTLIDLQGQPAAGVRLRVHAADTDAGAARRLLADGGARLVDARTLDGYAVLYTTTRGLGFDDYPSLKELTPLPREITSDARGRFRLSGFAAGTVLHLLVDDDRFAQQELKLKAGDAPQSLSLAPARWLEGTVTCGDTKRPLAGARLVAQTSAERVMPADEVLAAYAGSRFGPPALDRTETTTDAAGRFRLRLAVGDRATVEVTAPDGAPNLGVRREVRLPRGAVRHALDVALPRGVLLTGRVTESKSGDPVPEVEAYFLPQRDNNPGYRRDLLVGEPYPVFTDKKGAYRLVVPPQPGHLLLTAPGRDFVEEPITRAALYAGKPTARRFDGRPGGEAIYFHAARRLDLRPQEKPLALDLTLRRGVTLRGQVVGPDGKVPARAVLFCGGELLWDQPGLMRLHYLDGAGLGRALLLEGGRFELRGCDPEKTYRVFFMDLPEVKGLDAASAALTRILRDEPAGLGAVAELSAKGGPVTVRLHPSGSAAVRLLDARGRPLRPAKDAGDGVGVPLLYVDGKKRELHLYAELVVTPPRGGADAERVAVGLPFRLRGWDPALRPDAEGRLWLHGLIPGATYRLVAYDADAEGDGYPPVAFEREFRAESGRSVRLPDVTVRRAAAGAGR